MQGTINIFLFLVFAFNSLLNNAISAAPDNLEDELERTVSDTAKAMVYNRFALDLLRGQYWDYYQIQQHLSHGKQNEYYRQSIHYANLGLALAESAQYDKGQAELHRTIGTAHFYMDEYAAAVEHYEKALAICEKLRNINGMALNYYNIARVYRRQNTKIYYSLELQQKALSLWKQDNNTDNMYRAYQSIISLYLEIEELSLAATYAEEALSLAIETGNSMEEAQLYIQFAGISSSAGHLHTRDDYYQKALKIYQEQNDQLRIARVTSIIAAFTYSDNPKTAIGLLRKSAAIYEEKSPTNIQLFDVYNYLANMLHKQNLSDSVMYYKEKALSKAIISRDQWTMAAAYDSIGRFYMNIGYTTRAEQNYLHAYNIALRNGFYNAQSSALSGLSIVSYRRGAFKTAYEYLQKYQELNDSLNRAESVRNIRQMTMRYEFERDALENAEEAKVKFERQEQTVKYQKIVVAITSFAMLCALALMIFLIRSNRLKNKTNFKLEKQRIEILRINNELELSHHELFKYKDTLEEMVKEQTDKLRRSEIQLRTLSDNLQGGCIFQKHVSLDGKDAVSYISSTAEKWLGVNAEAIMEDINNLHRNVNPEDLEMKSKVEQASLRSLSPYSVEYRLKKGDSEVWLLQNAMPHIEKGLFVWDGVVIDITDRKKFEKELIEAKEHAEESERLKSAFLANMSHEIRTPLNGIVGIVQLLADDRLNREDRMEYIKMANNCCDQLVALINDIIVLSQIEAKQVKIEYVSVQINNLMEELFRFFETYMQTINKGDIKLLLDRSGFIDNFVINADPIRLRQVLINLINNAVKFTNQGYIRFGYSRLSPDKLEFSVEDTGIGLKPEHQEIIFERFRQIEFTNTRQHEGSGLGLSISRSLTQLMGGDLWLESEEGKGSTFYFTITV